MKNNKQYVVAAFLISLTLSGCNGVDPTQGATQTSENQSLTSGGPLGDPSVAFRTPVILDGAGQILAYVVGLQKTGFMTLYLPGLDQYMEVNQRTGKYRTNLVYYTGSGATGEAFAGLSTSWYGEVGKTVITNGAEYFLVDSPRATTVGVSYINGVNMFDFMIPTTETDAYNLVSITRPYDFESIAPLAITYQE